MTTNRCLIKKEDKVRITAGKDKDKIGKVIKVVRKHNRILVENVNIVKKHAKPSSSNRQGGIIEQEAPIHFSNVMLMCTKCHAPVRVKMKRLEDGNKKRVCRKCDEIIDS